MTGSDPRDTRPRTQPEAPASLQAPWRLEYLQALGEKERLHGEPDEKNPAGFLADYWAHPELDEQNHVLVRTQHGMVLLNAFPYANGHLLCALGEPRSRLLDYEPQQRAALWELVELATELCERGMHCQGVNTGINQGRAAGAGVPNHLHVHVVPRWSGDTNFIQVVGQVRVNPASLDRMAERYRAVLGEVRENLKQIS